MVEELIKWLRKSRTYILTDNNADRIPMVMI